MQGNRVVAVEQNGGVVTSESMACGMLIATMMGDKSMFDEFWGYVQTKLSYGLMRWDDGSGGSATDGDEDIAYALLVADKKWSGYGSAATAMINNVKDQDIDGDRLNPGQTWGDAFNPSYFAPSFFKKCSGMNEVIVKSHDLLAKNTGNNFPTDWSDGDGNPIDSAGEATAGFSRPAYGYDAARVPWRIGMDGCLAGERAVRPSQRPLSISCISCIECGLEGSRRQYH
jgi:endo-1,4-beta-D-glucanase Y